MGRYRLDSSGSEHRRVPVSCESVVHVPTWLRNRLRRASNKTSVRTAAVPDEIQTGYLLNRSAQTRPFNLEQQTRILKMSSFQFLKLIGFVFIYCTHKSTAIMVMNRTVNTVFIRTFFWLCSPSRQMPRYTLNYATISVLP